MKEIPIVEQIKTALQPRNRMAAVVGALLGGFVPVATYTIAHYDCPELLSVNAAFVAGGLLYSSTTVFSWGYRAFGSHFKAFGFALLLEGSMLVSSIEWLALAALCYLALVNAVATGCAIASDKLPKPQAAPKRVAAASKKIPEKAVKKTVKTKRSKASKKPRLVRSV